MFRAAANIPCMEFGNVSFLRRRSLGDLYHTDTTDKMAPWKGVEEIPHGILDRGVVHHGCQMRKRHISPGNPLQ